MPRGPNQAMKAKVDISSFLSSSLAPNKENITGNMRNTVKLKNA